MFNKKDKKLGALILSLCMMLTVLMPFNVQTTQAKEEVKDVQVTAVKEEAKVFSEESKVIDIISINDFHGNLAEEASEKGKNMGMSKVINAVKQYKVSNPNTIVVSGGDNYQGSAMSNLTFGAPVSKMFKEMDVVASSVGNHEFDWGIQRVEKWSKEGGFDFLAANIIDKTTGKPVEWAKPYKVVEKNGVKIGFFGLTTRDTAYTTVPANVANYDFADLKTTAEEWTNYLKSGKAPEGKVDVVIALTHVASFQDAKTKEITGDVVDSGLCDVKGLDAIVSAHSHQIVAGYVHNMPIVQGFKYGRALGKMTLSLDKNNKVVKVEPAVDELYNRKSELIADPNGAKIYDEYNKNLQPMLEEVVGKCTQDLSHERKTTDGVSVLGYWVSDLMRKEVNTQIGLVNEGGLRTSIPKGEITVGKLYEVMPFDNTLVKADVTGADLRKLIDNGIKNPNIGWVEVAGLKVTYDMSKPFGSRVVEMFLEDGTKIEDNKTYSVAANDFMLGGGDQYDFSRATNKVDTLIPLRDTITDYVRKQKEINVEFVQPLVAAKEVVKEAPKTTEKVVEVVKPVEKVKPVATQKVKETKVKKYIVKAGDTLAKIAAQFGLKYQEIAEYNNLKNPHFILVNQEILIPAN